MKMAEDGFRMILSLIRNATLGIFIDHTTSCARKADDSNDSNDSNDSAKDCAGSGLD